MKNLEGQLWLDDKFRLLRVDKITEVEPADRRVVDRKLADQLREPSAALCTVIQTGKQIRFSVCRLRHRIRPTADLTDDITEHLEDCASLDAVRGVPPEEKESAPTPRNS
jgi:hypothetical protein